MSELAAFLESCIAADEEAARAAMVVIGDDMTTYRIAEWWEKPEHARVYAGHWHPVVQAGETHGEPVFYNTAALPHIARHDPARVLADCEALRAVVEEHADFGDPTDQSEGSYHSDICSDGMGGNYPCRTLLLLAQPFAGRPGWDESWRINGHKEAQA